MSFFENHPNKLHTLQHVLQHIATHTATRTGTELSPLILSSKTLSADRWEGLARFGGEEGQMLVCYVITTYENVKYRPFVNILNRTPFWKDLKPDALLKRS